MPFLIFGGLPVSDLDSFLERFRLELSHRFGSDLLFFGIQGSYARGEAGPDSDIDPVVILSECSKRELRIYSELLDSFEERDLICGFTASASQLQAWDRADRVQLILDTKPLYTAEGYRLPSYTADDVSLAVLQGACALTHAVSHNILHERDWQLLKGQFKAARFVVRMKHLLDTGNYIAAFRELACHADDREKQILIAKEAYTEDDAWLLFEWASELVAAGTGKK